MYFGVEYYGQLNGHAVYKDLTHKSENGDEILLFCPDKYEIAKDFLDLSPGQCRDLLEKIKEIKE